MTHARYLILLLFVALAVVPASYAQGRGGKGRGATIEHDEQRTRTRGRANDRTARTNDRDDDGRYDNDRDDDGRYDDGRYHDRRYDDRRYDDRDWNDGYYGDRDGDRKGPAFCRSGAGHPVHGRQWCVDKGFGLGGRGWDQRYDRSRRDTWDDVVFGDPRRRNRGYVPDYVLEDILGRRTVARLDQMRYRFGLTGPLSGRWLDARRGNVLALFTGDRPLARLIDADGDRRVDRVLWDFRR